MAASRTLKFGTFDIMQVDPLVSTGKSVRRHLELARLADALGLDYVFLSERHFMPIYRAATPGLLLANLAATTSRVRLGVLAYTLPLRNPVLLAEEISMLDHLSGGRLDVGVGLGHRPQEIDALGLPSQHRQALFLESLAMMQQLWEGKPLSYDGAAYRVRGAQVDPPQQRPHPPLWYAGNDPVVASWAADTGLNLAVGFQSDEQLMAPTAAFNAGRGDNPDLRLAVMRHVYVAESDEQAREEMISDLMRLGADLAANPRGLPNAPTSAPTRATAERQFAEQQARQVIVSGGPDTVANALATMRLLGADVFLANTHLAGIGQERLKRTLSLFVREVIPRVRGHLGDSHRR
jgi:alkanesulfonate monooxygenase SsuD/methylene tetrahydromethanopterin reductase-like flavin-dependent oxidoreductase (luciferase family)